LIDRITLMDLTPSVLVRALAPLPIRVSTLDALHLATVVYLCERGDTVELASFDRRMLDAARAPRCVDLPDVMPRRRSA
jgi:hypothetical protein